MKQETNGTKQINKRRMLALLLALCMIATLLPMAAMASEIPDPGDNTIIIGGKEIDLNQNSITISQMTAAQLEEFYGRDLYLTGDGNKITITFQQPRLFEGSREFPLKAEYHSKLHLVNANTLEIMYMAGTPRLEGEANRYRFVNQIPGKFYVPQPVYIAEFEGLAEGWGFAFSGAENDWEYHNGYFGIPVDTATAKRIATSNPNYGCSFKSTQYRYPTPITTYYFDKNGTEQACRPGAVTGGRMAWSLTAYADAVYTVDIRPANAGGTPTLGGLTELQAGETLNNTLGTANASYWGDAWHGANPNDLASGGSYTVPAEATSSGWGRLNAAYTADAGVEEGYEVDSVTKKTYHYVTGELEKEETFQTLEEAVSTIEGKTEIEVSYVLVADGLVNGVKVVDSGTQAEVRAPEVGQELEAIIETSEGDITAGDKNANAVYRWHYQGSEETLGTDPVYTVTENDLGKILCVEVSVEGYAGKAAWTAGEAVVEPHVHDWGEGTVVKEATCTEPGLMRFTCVCGETKDEAISALGHGESVVKNAKEATCTAEGYTGDKVCARCGEVLEKGTSIAKLAHTPDEGTVTKEPTETEKGEKTYKCKVCGAVVKTEELPALGKPVDPEAPPTGDNTNLPLLAGTMLVSLAAIAGLAVALVKKGYLKK